MKNLVNSQNLKKKVVFIVLIVLPTTVLLLYCSERLILHLKAKSGILVSYPGREQTIYFFWTETRSKLIKSTLLIFVLKINIIKGSIGWSRIDFDINCYKFYYYLLRLKGEKRLKTTYKNVGPIQIHGNALFYLECRYSIKFKTYHSDITSYNGRI